MATKKSAEATGQQVVLTIGYTDILLPSSAGVEAVMKVLSRGEHCREQLYSKKIMVEEEPLTIKLTYVPAKTDIVRPTDPKRLTHVAVVDPTQFFP